MALDAKIYDRLYAIDPEIAEEYIYSESRSTILWGMLQEIRDMFEIPVGVSVLKALSEVAVEPVAGDPVEQPVKQPVDKPAQTRMLKDNTYDRKSLIKELDELGIPWKPSDSSKRLSSLLKRRRATTSRKLEVKTPKTIKPDIPQPTIDRPTIAKKTIKQDTKKSIIKGWG